MEPAEKLKKHSEETSRNIPDDLLFEEILVRLPLKSLTVYKSVCKTWLHTIESSSFRDAHRRRHIRYNSDQVSFSSFKSVFNPITFVPGLVERTFKPLNTMLPSYMTRLKCTSFRHGNSRASVTVLGHIRTTGIYCIASLHLGPLYWHLSPVSTKFFICNPATRDYRLANPFPPDEMLRVSKLTDGYANYGFGLAADGDYKVVVVIQWDDGFLSYVYSMRQGLWKKLLDSENGMVSRIDLRGKTYFPDIFDLGELCPQVFLNSCWHWTCKSWGGKFEVLSFDVDNEVFKLVSAPPSYTGPAITKGDMSSKELTCLVSVLNDHLVVIHHTCFWSDNDSRSVISVWMMMEYGAEESWINVWEVNLEAETMRTFVGISYSLRADGNGGIHIHRILFQDSRQQLVSCDEFGVIEQEPGLDTSSCIFWNNFGISAYSETLERL